MKLIKDIEKLNPEFRSRFLVGFKFCKEVLGIDIRVGETLREFTRQKDLFVLGFSDNEVGKHNFGYAADFDIFINGDYQEDDESGLYLRCGFVFMALGLRWGGNWDRDRNIAEKGEFDFRHVEAVKPTVAELKKALEA